MTVPVDLRRRILLLPLAFAALFVLAGCGIKGPLELPADAQAKNAKATTNKGEIPKAARLPGYYQPPKHELKEVKQLGKPEQPDTPFFLDPLLK